MYINSKFYQNLKTSEWNSNDIPLVEYFKDNSFKFEIIYSGPHVMTATLVSFVS